MTNSMNSAKATDDTPPERPKYVTRKKESPPLFYGPERVHYAYSVALPLIHLTFVSIVQGFAVGLLLQSFPLPPVASLASVANFVAFVGMQHAYLPYAISGLIVILVWKQFVQASMFVIWPLSTSQIALILMISLTEAIAFREVTHFTAWLGGLGLVGIVGGSIRLNNIRVQPASYFSSEVEHHDNFTLELRNGILYVLLGILISIGALIVHAWLAGGTAPFVSSVEWGVLVIMSCLMSVVVALDHRDLISIVKDATLDSDLQVDRFGGVSYVSEHGKDTQSR